MSGRIRTVKPELLEDAVTAGLSDRAFRLFIAVILMADDYGRLRAEPRFLAGQVYWLRECALEDLTVALRELDRLVLFYEVHGQQYAEIRNWAKHQKVSHPGKPRVPAPSESLETSSGESPETLRPLIPISDLRSPTSDQGGGTPETPPESAPAPVTAEPSSLSRPGLVDLDMPYLADAERVWASRTLTKEPGKPANDVWANFLGHFAGTDFGARQALLGRWSKWVDKQCDIASKERQADYDRRDSQERRDKSFKARFDKPAGAIAHEAIRQPTAADSRRMADELARRLAALPTPDRKPAA